MNPPVLHPVDAAIVGAYFLLVTVFGVWAGRRRIRTADALFLADREATWPLIGASMFSANISSQQFVGQAGLAYTIGLAAGSFQLIGAACFALLAVFFVDVYLGLRLRTAPEFFERRYGTGARLFVAGINVVMIVAANLATALYAGATVLSGVVGADVAPFGAAVLAIAAAAGAYAVLGGLRSVLWTDLVQTALLVAGGITTLVAALTAAGGWAAVRDAHDASGRSLWSVVQPWDHAFGWLPLLTGALILGVHGHCTDHDYVQRALAARSRFHAKMGALFAAFLKLVALLAIAAPGVVAAKLLPGLAHPDRAYVELVNTYLPPGWKGLVLAGLLASILGTVAAGLAAAAAMLTLDFAVRLRPGLSERGRVRLGRGLMVLLLLIGAALAPGIRDYGGVFKYLVQLWSLLAPPVFVCVVAGVFTIGATRRGATATLAVGTLLGATAFPALSDPATLATLPIYLRSPLNCGFVIALVCAGTMAWASRGGNPAGTTPPGIWRRGVDAHDGMTARERQLYRTALATLAATWLAVVVWFSPWGWATHRPETRPTPAAAP
ncbi:MAG: hypothetical protein RLZZ447_1329 [Verrucomicrobiota bacterium]